MDATIFGFISATAGLGGVFAFGVSVGRTRGVRADLDAIAKWKDGLSKELNETFVPRRELALELQPIRESLARIEKALDAQA